jgi:peptidoglycan hydrolase CwlO-like protein
MPEPTNQELKDLILNLEKLFLSLEKTVQNLEKIVQNLDKKIDIQFIELKSDIRSVEERLGGEIKPVEEKINGIDKRIGNEEFISRGALTAVFVSISAGVIKFLFSSSVP